jgi:hypothetical protein
VLGAVPLASYLTLLRKNQRGEYEEAFKQAVGNSPVGVPKKPHSTTPSKNSKTGDHVDESDNASQASRSSQASSAARGGGAKSSSPATAEPKQGGSHAHAHAHHHPHNHGAQGSGVIQTHGNHPPRANELPAINEADEHRKFYVLVHKNNVDTIICPYVVHGCNFCGAGADITDWTEEELDDHYLQDCPMLAACPACAQVWAVCRGSCTGVDENELCRCLRLRHCLIICLMNVNTVKIMCLAM